MVVTQSADLDLAVRAITFAAIGTAGQRCTTLRRLIVHGSVREALLRRLKRAYASARVGNPLDPEILVGPLIDRDAFERMQAALATARTEGGEVFGGERILAAEYPSAFMCARRSSRCRSRPGSSKKKPFADPLYDALQRR